MENLIDLLGNEKSVLRVYQDDLHCYIKIVLQKPNKGVLAETRTYVLDFSKVVKLVNDKNEKEVEEFVTKNYWTIARTYIWLEDQLINLCEAEELVGMDFDLANKLGKLLYVKANLDKIRKKIKEEGKLEDKIIYVAEQLCNIKCTLSEFEEGKNLDISLRRSIYNEFGKFDERKVDELEREIIETFKELGKEAFYGSVEIVLDGSGKRLDPSFSQILFKTINTVKESDKNNVSPYCVAFLEFLNSLADLQVIE